MSEEKKNSRENLVFSTYKIEGLPNEIKGTFLSMKTPEGRRYQNLQLIVDGLLKEGLEATILDGHYDYQLFVSDADVKALEGLITNTTNKKGLFAQSFDAKSGIINSDDENYRKLLENRIRREIEKKKYPLIDYRFVNFEKLMGHIKIARDESPNYDGETDESSNSNKKKDVFSVEAFRTRVEKRAKGFYLSVDPSAYITRSGLAILDDIEKYLKEGNTFQLQQFKTLFNGQRRIEINGLVKNNGVLLTANEVPYGINGETVFDYFKRRGYTFVKENNPVVEVLVGKGKHKQQDKMPLSTILQIVGPREAAKLGKKAPDERSSQCLEIVERLDSYDMAFNGENLRLSKEMVKAEELGYVKKEFESGLIKVIMRDGKLLENKERRLEDLNKKLENPSGLTKEEIKEYTAEKNSLEKEIKKTKVNVDEAIRHIHKHEGPYSGSIDARYVVTMSENMKKDLRDRIKKTFDILMGNIFSDVGFGKLALAQNLGNGGYYFLPSKQDKAGIESQLGKITQDLMADIKEYHKPIIVLSVLPYNRSADFKSVIKMPFFTDYDFPNQCIGEETIYKLLYPSLRDIREILGSWDVHDEEIRGNLKKNKINLEKAVEKMNKKLMKDKEGLKNKEKKLEDIKEKLDSQGDLTSKIIKEYIDEKKSLEKEIQTLEKKIKDYEEIRVNQPSEEDKEKISRYAGRRVNLRGRSLRLLYLDLLSQVYLKTLHGTGSIWRHEKPADEHIKSIKDKGTTCYVAYTTSTTGAKTTFNTQILDSYGLQVACNSKGFPGKLTSKNFGAFLGEILDTIETHTLINRDKINKVSRIVFLKVGNYDPSEKDMINDLSMSKGIFDYELKNKIKKHFNTLSLDFISDNREAARRVYVRNIGETKDELEASYRNPEEKTMLINEEFRDAYIIVNPPKAEEATAIPKHIKYYKHIDLIDGKIEHLEEPTMKEIAEEYIKTIYMAPLINFGNEPFHVKITKRIAEYSKRYGPHKPLRVYVEDLL